MPNVVATETQAIVENATENIDIAQRDKDGVVSNETEPVQGPGDRLTKYVYLKLVSAGFSFFVAGVNDGSIGTLTPYVIRQYNINTAIVSSIYGANFLGWLFAAITNAYFSQYLSLGSMLVFGAVFQILAQALRSWNLPFGLFAFQDTHANTYVAGIKASHRWLGFIHAMYKAGSLIGPFISAAVASAGKVPRWYLFYTFPLGLGVLNLCLTCVAFRDSMGLQHTSADHNDNTTKNEDATRLIKKTTATLSVWLLSLFFFFYLGAGVTTSGWAVEYLVNVRHGNLKQMGYVPAGLNGGSLLGRLLLPEPTHRFGERRMVLCYILASIGLQLIFWLVPNIISASIAVCFIGFFQGTSFPTAMSLASTLFPPTIRSTALPFVFVRAQMGGSHFPIITGVLSSDVGATVMQPMLVSLLAATAISWLLVPMPKSTSSNTLHQ
ncbi:MFS general substrate transporter [Trichoderma velutinum]